MAKHKKKNTVRNGWSEDYRTWNGHGNQQEKVMHNTTRGWNTGDAPKVCTACSYHDNDNGPKIYLSTGVQAAIYKLCADIKLEWQMLLTGRIEQDGDVIVDGYWIPKQTITAASVQNEDLVDAEVIRTRGIVAGIHSHGTMGVFFSHTDIESTNMSQIRHNIVVNNKHEFVAQSRVDLPCGMVKFLKAQVMLVYPTTTEVIGIENIKTRTYVEPKWNYSSRKDQWDNREHKPVTQNTLSLGDAKVDAIPDGNGGYFDYIKPDGVWLKVKTTKEGEPILNADNTFQVLAPSWDKDAKPIEYEGYSPRDYMDY